MKAVLLDLPSFLSVWVGVDPVLKSSRRNVTVYFSLVAALTVTSLILRALSPKPLTPDAATTLFAADTSDAGGMDAIFETRAAIQPGRWQSIYIHHSATAGGDARSLSQGDAGLPDHFLIGNGDGCADGAVQLGQRWTQQQSAAYPGDGRALRDQCISICLVGDFDRSAPTATQMQRLSQLVAALRGRLQIAAEHIVILDQPQGGPANVGRKFPISAFLAEMAH